MKLIYPSQSVASALRWPPSGLYVRVRDACDRQYIWRPLATAGQPCDIVIHNHFRVHPVRPCLDKGLPSFPATCEFDHRPGARLEPREKPPRGLSFIPLPPLSPLVLSVLSFGLRLPGGNREMLRKFSPKWEIYRIQRNLIKYNFKVSFFFHFFLAKSFFRDKSECIDSTHGDCTLMRLTLSSVR